MKKRFLGLTVASIASIVFGMLFLSIQTTTAETQTAQNWCSNTNPNAYQTIERNGYKYQAPFTPKVNRLTQVSGKFAGNPNGDGASGKAILQIVEHLTLAVVAQSSFNYTNLTTSSPTILYFNNWLNDDDNVIELDTNKAYRVNITSDQTDSAEWLYWYTTGDIGNCTNVTRHTFSDNPTGTLEEKSFYMDFTVWGYQIDAPAAPVNDNPGTPIATSNSTSSVATTTEESLGETSTLITKATKLTAKFETDEEKETRGVKLSWNASDTGDIDGYKVFRSLKRKSGYTKIGTTDVNTLEFLDDSIGSTTTYYYVVRAYQGTLQSASSNVAVITTPAGIGPGKVKNLKVTDYTQNSMLVTWDINEEENVVGYVISAQIANGSKISTYKVEKEISSYKITGLEPGEIYKISVQAKDDKDELSGKASVFQHTLYWNYNSYFETSYTTTALTTLASLLTLTLIWLIAKRRKKMKV